MYYIILTKNGFGYILGDFLQTHLVTLAIRVPRWVGEKNYPKRPLRPPHQDCQMVYFHTNNSN
jgi:hypothetical protein